MNKLFTKYGPVFGDYKLTKTEANNLLTALKNQFGAWAVFAIVKIGKLPWAGNLGITYVPKVGFYSHNRDGGLIDKSKAIEIKSIEINSWGAGWINGQRGIRNRPVASP
jgi:hypothetical protein